MTSNRRHLRETDARRAPPLGETPVDSTVAGKPSDARAPRHVEAETNHVERADQAGLREAFLACGELFGFARRSLGSAETAEDAVQETFARAWRFRTRFDVNLGSLRTWLLDIERRVVLDLGARQIKSPAFPFEASHDVAYEDRIEVAMLGWQMESALERLSPEHRLVITEIYFNGRSGREVAELFALPEGTVRSRAFFALRMLRLLLEESRWVG